eukprot:3026972-Rhodomonas_salina.1
MSVQVRLRRRPRRRNAFTVLKQAQKKYQVQIQPWTLEEQHFQIREGHPFVEAVCKLCEEPIPSGLNPSAAFQWMLCHLYCMGAHGNTEFPDKCKAIGYTARGQFWDRHHMYWHMKMWIMIMMGEPDAEDENFLAPPTHLGFSPQLILN